MTAGARVIAAIDAARERLDLLAAAVRIVTTEPEIPDNDGARMARVVAAAHAADVACARAARDAKHMTTERPAAMGAAGK